MLDTIIIVITLIGIVEFFRKKSGKIIDFFLYAIIFIVLSPILIPIFLYGFFSTFYRELFKKKVQKNS